jgi:NAD(P)-dependent dehydrogenase (short-subunit alcohol dehydrogenase family)
MSNLDFDGRVVAVTGAARGLGRGYALHFAKLGAKVVVADLGGSTEGSGHDAGPAEQVVAEIRAAGGTAVADDSDVSTPEGGAAIVAKAVDTFGRIDAVVNNAGNMIWGGPDEIDAAGVRKTLDVHVMGSFNVVKAAWPYFDAQNYGRIVLTGSTGMFGLPDNLAYAIAKAGMIGFAKSITVHRGDRDITANVICPNASTRLGEAPGRSIDTGSAPRRVDPAMSPENVAPLVAYLAHEACPVSGEVYVAGSGKFARIFVAGTPGYVHGTDPSATIDDVAANWEQINDETGYYVPTSLFNWSASFFSHR